MVLAIDSFASQLERESLKIYLVLKQAELSLVVTSETLSDTGELLADSEDLLGKSGDLLRSVGAVIGEDATTTIQSTQDALEAAIPGAQAIDSMLKALSILEPVTGFAYDPDKSLSQSMDDVTASLEPLPTSLREVQNQLDEAADELNDLIPGLTGVAEDLSQFSDTIKSVSSDINSTDDLFKSIRQSTERIQNRVAPISWISTIILSVFFALGAISQLTAFLVGKQN
jgi:uncharacterized phage infection (PIP) family protein YhgE